MVARVGGEASPPLPVPGPLRPLLGFAKFPDRALATVKQVLDADEEFRSRVALVADEGELGRASYLYLTRPAGWEPELADLQGAATEAAAAAQDEQDERSARRRLRGAEQAAQRAEQALAKARAEMTQSANDLATERRARRTAEHLLTSLQSRHAAVEAERDASRSAARAAKEGEKGARDRLVAVQQERDSLRQAVTRLESEEPSSPPAAPDPKREIDLAAVAEAVEEATQAAQRLERALASASASLRQVSPGQPPTATTAGLVSGAAPDRPATRAPRRVPVRLPPAVFEDSAEAAEYLVRVNGMTVLVDGYNASFLAWGQMSVADQRRRLIDALGELVARTGTTVHVVFDGAEGAELPPSAAARSLVRIAFSPPGVDADEVIIDLAASWPVAQPLVVATSDRRVQDEVRRRGTNVISSTQLLGVLGRSAGQEPT